MIQLLNILSDVIRIATFHWQDEKPHRRTEGPADCARWSPSADWHSVRRLRS